MTSHFQKMNIDSVDIHGNEVAEYDHLSF